MRPRFASNSDKVGLFESLNQPRVDLRSGIARVRHVSLHCRIMFGEDVAAFRDEIYEGETISSAIVDCVSIDGADIFPGNVLNGATIIDGTNVLQFFQVGVSGWSWSCRPSYQFSGRADEVLQVLFLLNSWS